MTLVYVLLEYMCRMWGIFSFIYMWQPGLTGDDAAYGTASDLQKGDAAASFTQ